MSVSGLGTNFITVKIFEKTYDTRSHYVGRPAPMTFLLHKNVVLIGHNEYYYNTMIDGSVLIYKPSDSYGETAVSIKGKIHPPNSIVSVQLRKAFEEVAEYNLLVGNGRD